MPREFRTCRLCLLEVEDEPHATLECQGHPGLHPLRVEFWNSVASLPGHLQDRLQSKRFWGPLVALRGILREGDTNVELATIFGRLTWKVMQIFQTVDLYIPDAAHTDTED